MGDTTKTPPFPRPEDLDARVYAAFMGHAPQVCPPEEAEPDVWQNWPLLRELHGPRWERLRRICNESLLSPRARERFAPVLAHARKRWAEARERLTKGRYGAALPDCTCSPEVLHDKTRPEPEHPLTSAAEDRR